MTSSSAAPSATFSAEDWKSACSKHLGVGSPNRQGAGSGAGPERDRRAAPFLHQIGRRPSILAVRQVIICDGSTIEACIVHGYVRECQHVDTVTCTATNTFWRDPESACGRLNGQAAGQLRGSGGRGACRPMGEAWRWKLGRWEERDGLERGREAGIKRPSVGRIQQ